MHTLRSKYLHLFSDTGFTYAFYVFGIYLQSSAYYFPPKMPMLYEKVYNINLTYERVASASRTIKETKVKETKVSRGTY